MNKLVCLAPFGIAMMLGGCGTYVPGIQELPGDSEGGQRFVQAIVTNITCEAQDAFYDLYQDYKIRKGDKESGTFMNDWGVQITLKITTDEKGSVNPTVNWLPPSPVTNVFNLAAGATLSSEATRTNVLNSYYLVSDLRNRRCPPQIRGGPFLLESDLKLKEWLYDMVLASGSGVVQFGKDAIGGPFKGSVISHEVKFEIISSGTVTPTWKLTRVQYNPTGTLLSLSRDRTHDLTITIGPADSTYVIAPNGVRQKVYIPSQQAADIHLSNLIGSAVGQAVGSALRP
jgi:hypothetical protein